MKRHHDHRVFREEADYRRYLEDRASDFVRESNNRVTLVLVIDVEIWFTALLPVACNLICHLVVPVLVSSSSGFAFLTA